MRTISTPVSIAPPLRAVRTARGLTLRDVAHRSGIDPGYLSKVERGQKSLSIETLHRVAVVLELRELAQLLKPYVVERLVEGNSDAAGVAPPAASVERNHETTAKQIGTRS